MAKINMDGDYTQVPNSMVIDMDITPNAFRFWVYVQSKPSTWKFYDKNIITETKWGKRSLARWRAELSELGYLGAVERIGNAGAKDGWDYYLGRNRGDWHKYKAAHMLEKPIATTEDGDIELPREVTQMATGGGDTNGDTLLPPVSPLSKKDLSKKDSLNVTGKPDDDIPKAFTETMLDALEVAQYLSAKLSESIDNYKQPSIAGLHKWAKDIDLAIRLDNRTKAQLIDAINWIHYEAGSFWIGNVKSGKKLRSQFDTLTAQRAPAKEKVNIRTKALQAFGVGKPFFSFKDTQNDNRSVKVCIYGDYNALYDYNRSEYIAKDQANKVWDHIEKNFDAILANLKKGV